MAVNGAAPGAAPAARFRLREEHLAAIAELPTVHDAWVFCTRYVRNVRTPDYPEFAATVRAMGASELAALRATAEPWLRPPAQTCTMQMGDFEHVFECPECGVWPQESSSSSRAAGSQS